jgi:hypothetical protein
MNEDRKQKLLDEARYAERLTQRTARLYRRVGTLFTFLAILGGSGTMAALSSTLPDWVSIGGAALLALTGAAALAIRPLEKALTNEADARKYAVLRTQAVSLDVAQLEAALQKARETDAPEIELLRDVAFNDLLREIGRPDLMEPLSARQKMLETMA